MHFNGDLKSYNHAHSFRCNSVYWTPALQLAHIIIIIIIILFAQ